MQKKNKRILLGISILAVSGGIYYIINQLRKQNRPITVNGAYDIINTTIKGNNNPTTTSEAGFPLKMGSKGDLVKTLQQYIKLHDSSALPIYGIDGEFGHETEMSLYKWKGVKQIDNSQQLSALAPNSNVPFLVSNPAQPQMSNTEASNLFGIKI